MPVNAGKKTKKLAGREWEQGVNVVGEKARVETTLVPNQYLFVCGKREDWILEWIKARGTSWVVLSHDTPRPSIGPLSCPVFFLLQTNK